MKLKAERKKRIWNKFTPATLLIVVILGSIIYGSKEASELNENAAYTIGTTVKTYWTVAYGQWVIYSYWVEGNRYTGNSRYIESTKVPGGKYYVKFNKKDPEESVFVQDKPVPDTIKIAPEKGWEKIP